MLTRLPHSDRVVEATDPPPPPASPPMIRVEDWDEDPRLLAVKYAYGDNEIEFLPFWKKVKTLKDHAGRGFLYAQIQNGERREYYPIQNHSRTLKMFQLLHAFTRRHYARISSCCSVPCCSFSAEAFHLRVA